MRALCFGAVIGLLVTAAAHAQAPPAAAAPLVCEAKGGERQSCAGDTSAGVVLIKSTGAGACLLGKTWGYDSAGVWVQDGCGGEFLLGPPARAAAQTQTAAPANGNQPFEPAVETWGEFNPGKGFLVGRNSAGELDISGYALVRFVDQVPASQNYADHLGNTRTTDGRNDIWPHRVMIFFTGWLGDKKLVYALTLWTVLDTDQNAIFGNIGYQFSRKFSLYAGLNGNPGTRSLQGSHPLWLGQDRVMADEFFRPFFGAGVWAQGEPVSGLWYQAMLGITNSSLGIKSSQLDRKYTEGASVWWMPTTKEFGPKGAYGDWESHKQLATRFGVSAVWSPEQSFADSQGSPNNSTIRLADGLNVFEPGALAPGATVQTVDYRILSFDAGMKYRGIFLQTEIYNRWLDNFNVGGAALPVSSIHDKGFYVQAAFYPVKKKLEVYGATSQIFGDKSAGFDDSSEYLAGMNVYPFNTRFIRLNAQVIDVHRSPVSSAFGYYVGGQTGTTFATGFSVFF